MAVEWGRGAGGVGQGCVPVTPGPAASSPSPATGVAWVDAEPVWPPALPQFPRLISRVRSAEPAERLLRINGLKMGNTSGF